MKSKHIFGIVASIFLLIMPTLLIAGEENPLSSESNTLTFGMVKKHVKVGQSTQEDVAKLFGSPDNMVMRKGKEIWIYDRFKVETNVSSESGYGTIILAGGSKRTASSSTSLKTITVIIDFTEQGVVADLTMRVGGY